MSELSIVSCTLKIVWSDGVEEDLSPDLPECVREEIEQYLDDLEDLRNEQGADYNFSEVQP